MKKLISIFPFTLLLVFLAGCTDSGTSIDQTRATNGPSGLPTPGLPTPKGGEPENDTEGTFILGGGNGAGICQPLEACSFKPLSNELTKATFQTLFSLLDSKSPGFSAELRSAIQSRVWYLGPSGLKVIPSARIGVSFETHQLALQSRHEVWIDKAAFLKLTAEEQALLMVHEAIMVMMVDRRAAEANKSKWLDVPGAKSLSDEEHQIVRLLTIELLRGNAGEMSPARFVARLSQLGFINYAPAIPGLHVGMKFGPNELSDLVLSKQSTGDLAVLGSRQIDSGVDEGKCSLAVDENEKFVNLNFFFESALAKEEAQFQTEGAALAFSQDLGIHLEIIESVEKPKVGSSSRQVLRLVFQPDGNLDYEVFRQYYIFEPQSIADESRGFKWITPSSVQREQKVRCNRR